MERGKLDSVIGVVNGQLNPAGYDCIEAEWSGNERILRLFVDLLAGDQPITLGGCVKASKLLDEFAPLDDMISGHYVMEVSSPGVERPLRRVQDFQRYVGEVVEVKLREKIDGRRQGKGSILSIDLDADLLITLVTEQGNWSFPLASVQRASLVYDWNNN